MSKRSGERKFQKSGMLHLPVWVACILILSCALPLRAATPLERNLKKIERYQKDGFCEDALSLAEKLKKSKEGKEVFEVWLHIIEAKYCLFDVAGSLATAAELRATLALSATQDDTLTRFFRGQIESSFSRIRFSLPNDKNATVDIHIQVVDKLSNPDLEPFFTAMQTKMAAGLNVPSEVYLPFGTYDIDGVVRELRDYEGTRFVIGKEKLSLFKRSQIGDGQAFGFGFFKLARFSGTPYSVERDSDTQVLVGEERLSYSTSPYFELSTTHSSRWGTLGMVGLRATLRLRPPASFLGGVSSGEDYELIPTFYGFGLSLHIDVPGPKGLSFQGGVGGQVIYLAYMRYLAFFDEVSEASDGVVLAGLDVPVWGGGPVISLATTKTIRAGDRGFQLGLEVQTGVLSVSPLDSTGTVQIDGESLHYKLQEESLWGFNVGGMLFLRTPLF